jgi:hypothetical protein
LRGGEADEAIQMRRRRFWIAPPSARNDVDRHRVARMERSDIRESKGCLRAKTRISLALNPGYMLHLNVIERLHFLLSAIADIDKDVIDN